MKIPEQQELGGTAAVQHDSRSEVRSAHRPKVTAPFVDGGPESAVSLQRDSSGRFYHLVANAQTGQVILEFPPEAVRKAGLGIAEYIQEHARLTKRLEAKA